MVVLTTLCAGEVGALEALAGPSGAQLALVGGVQVVAGSAGTAGAVGDKVEGGIAGSANGAGLAGRTSIHSFFALETLVALLVVPCWADTLVLTVENVRILFIALRAG